MPLRAQARAASEQALGAAIQTEGELLAHFVCAPKARQREICTAQPARLHQDELGARRERVLGDDHPEHAKHANLLQGEKLGRFTWTPRARQLTTTAPLRR